MTYSKRINKNIANRFRRVIKRSKPKLDAFFLKKLKRPYRPGSGTDLAFYINSNLLDHEDPITPAAAQSWLNGTAKPSDTNFLIVERLFGIPAELILQGCYEQSEEDFVTELKKPLRYRTDQENELNDSASESVVQWTPRSKLDSLISEFGEFFVEWVEAVKSAVSEKK